MSDIDYGCDDIDYGCDHAIFLIEDGKMICDECGANLDD